MDIHALEDKDLWEISLKYGANAREWKRRFVGLLPEVHRRRLWKQHGFGSVVEYAAKIGGVSKNQVYLVLNLEKRFADKPVLYQALIKGEASVHNLSCVASSVNEKNAEFWAHQAKTMPARALETLVRDNRQDSPRTGLHVKTLELEDEVKDRLVKMQAKGVNVNHLLMELLDEHEEKKRKVATPAKSRYVPKQVRKLIQKEHGDQCSVPGCEKDAKALHHTRRFGLVKSHDPRYLAPLCREHHTIAHQIDLATVNRQLFAARLS